MGDLNTLLNYITSTKVHYDLVLHAGDFSNIDKKKHDDPIEEAKALSEATETLNAIKDKLQIPVYFVPGNHEAAVLYDGCRLGSVHKKSVMVADRLALIGFGGAPPGVQFVNGNWVEVWEGYPQPTHEAFDNDVTSFFNEEVNKYSPDTDFIFLTHCGPWNMETTVSGSGVYTGSRGIKEILDHYDKRVFLAPHGHLHEKLGIVRKKDTDYIVVNPGPVLSKRAAHILLSRTRAGKWNVNDIKLITI
jgi:Icc-related predicted phosphoesterase